MTNLMSEKMVGCNKEISDNNIVTNVIESERELLR